MHGDGFAQHGTSLIVPAARFTGGTQRILVEPCLILTGLATVTLGDVGMNRTDSTEQLIAQPNCASILSQLAHVVPGQVGKEQRQAIHLHSP